MTDDRGFAKRVPGAAFPKFLEPVFADGWAYAAAGGLLTALLLMASHVFGVANSKHLGFRQLLLVVFDPPTGLRIAGALVLAAAVIALRRGVAARSRDASRLADVVLIATAVLGAAMVVGAIVGAADYITFLSDSIRTSLDAVFFELAVMVLSATASVWALGELDARRRQP